VTQAPVVTASPTTTLADTSTTAAAAPIGLIIGIIAAAVAFLILSFVGFLYCKQAVWSKQSPPQQDPVIFAQVVDDMKNNNVGDPCV